VFQKTGVTHFDRTIAGDTASPEIPTTDVFAFDLKLDNEASVSLTGIQGDTDLQAFVDSLNAAISITALLGRVQAIRTDDGRIGFQVIDTAVDKFTLTAIDTAGKLGFGAGPITKQNLTKVLGGLGKLSVGVERGRSRLSFAADGTPELRFRFHYAADRSSQFNIDLGEEAANKGVSFDPGTSLKVKTALDAELALGMTLGSSARFFLDVGSFDLSATNTGAEAITRTCRAISRSDSARARRPERSSDPEPEISLFAGLNLGAAVAGLSAFDASEQTQVLDRLAHDSDNALNINLPIKVKPGILFAPDITIRFASQDDAVPFTGRQLPLVDLADGTTGDSFDNIATAQLFERLDPTGFVQLVGQVRDFLAKVADSDLFAKFDIPFNTAPLAKVAELGDTFFRAVMFDDGRDGKDEDSDKKLVTDLNKALEEAGLDDLIQAGIER
jgi:hypothetical protein